MAGSSVVHSLSLSPTGLELASLAAVARNGQLKVEKQLADERVQSIILPTAR